MEAPKDQPYAKYILEGLLQSSRLPQVLLFFGPQGSQKKFYAEVFAKQVLEVKEGDPPLHPDLVFMRPEGKLGLYTLEAIRGFLKESVLPPYLSKRRVFIFLDAEKMLLTGANALLKALEEPVATTHIILVSNDKHKILPTILSRSFKIPFAPSVSLKKSAVSKEETALFRLLKEDKLPYLSIRSSVESILEEWEIKKKQYTKTLEKSDLDEKEIQAAAHFFEKKLFHRMLEEVLYWFRDLKLLFFQQKEHLYHVAYKETLQNLLEQGGMRPLEKIEKAARMASQRFDLGASPRLLLERFFLEIA